MKIKCEYSFNKWPFSLRSFSVVQHRDLLNKTSFEYTDPQNWVEARDCNNVIKIQL
jgi:hypothetical protein